MAAKSDKKAERNDSREIKAGSLAEKRKTAYILGQLGYSQRAIAQTLQCSCGSVVAWQRAGREEIGELPIIQAAVDRLTCVIPNAANRLARLIHSRNERVALDAAKLILISSRVLVDRKTSEQEGDFDKPTSELIAEAQRLIAQRGETVGASESAD